VMPETHLRQTIETHGFGVVGMNYRLTGDGRHFEYRMMLSTLDEDKVRALSETLRADPSIVEFRIAPSGD